MCCERSAATRSSGKPSARLWCHSVAGSLAELSRVAAVKQRDGVVGAIACVVLSARTRDCEQQVRRDSLPARGSRPAFVVAEASEADPAS